jgi:hypothetical protein
MQDSDSSRDNARNDDSGIDSSTAIGVSGDGTDQVWPDDLELGDKFEFDGYTYEVVSTGLAEATADRVDNDEITVEMFRWAITDQVGIELETAVSQEEFGHSLQTDTNHEANE